MASLRILLATDGSSEASTAVDVLRALPLPPQSAIHVVSAVSVLNLPDTPGTDEREKSLWELARCDQETARAALRSAVAALADRGVAVSSEIVPGDAAEAILQAADAWSAELIVLGAKGRSGLARLLLGSVSRAIAQRASRPVLVTRPPRCGFRSVILALDGSVPAAAAARFLARFPPPPGTEVVVCHVLRPGESTPDILPGDPDALDEALREIRRREETFDGQAMEQVRAQLSAAGVEVTAEVRAGDPASEILAVAEEREADLIVAGARSVSPIEGFLFGSVADRLLQDATCCVLLAR